MVKRSEHFAVNKCSVLFSEMFSTFDRGLTLQDLAGDLTTISGGMVFQLGISGDLGGDLRTI